MATFSADVYQNEFLPDGGTDVHAIVTVSCSGAGAAGQSESGDAAEIIIVDTSGSMGEDKIRAVQQAAAAALDQVLDGVWCAVIAGNHQARLAFPVGSELPMVRMDERARAEALPVIWGDAARDEVLQAARPRQAKLLILALPGAYEARQVMALVRAVNPTIEIAVRTHDDDEIAWLRQEASVGLAVMGEREVALGMADFALQRLGVPASTAQATVDVLRARMPGEVAA